MKKFLILAISLVSLLGLNYFNVEAKSIRAVPYVTITNVTPTQTGVEYDVSIYDTWNTGVYGYNAEIVGVSGSNCALIGEGTSHCSFSGLEPNTSYTIFAEFYFPNNPADGHATTTYDFKTSQTPLVITSILPLEQTVTYGEQAVVIVQFNNFENVNLNSIGNLVVNGVSYPPVIQDESSAQYLIDTSNLEYGANQVLIESIEYYDNNMMQTLPVNQLITINIV